MNPPYIIAMLLALAAIVSCSGQKKLSEGGQGQLGERLRVVATTTIVGDVVRSVGGDQIDLQILLPPGADPHAYEATPRDVAALNEADLVFINGLGLETLLEPLMEEARASNRVVSVSDGIVPLTPGVGEAEQGVDPHVWFDPQRVSQWVDNIENALSLADPDNEVTYRENAASYQEKLQELDRWIMTQVSEVPQANRLLITDHDSLGYLADRYDLELVGTVIPGFDTQAQPTAKDLAELIELIEQRAVRAVFVSEAVNPAIAEQIALDTGIELIPLNTGSLGEPGGDSSTYLDFMRAAVETITSGLRSSN